VDNILQLWTDGLKELSQSKFPFHLKVEGEFNSYLVYAVQFVKVQFSIEPAEQLEVIVGDKIPVHLQGLPLVDWAVFGLLDVLMLQGPLSIAKARIVVEGAEYDRIESSPMAFRFAGRDAGRKALQQIKDARSNREIERPS